MSTSVGIIFLHRRCSTALRSRGAYTSPRCHRRDICLTYRSDDAAIATSSWEDDVGDRMLRVDELPPRAVYDLLTATQSLSAFMPSLRLEALEASSRAVRRELGLEEGEDGVAERTVKEKDWLVCLSVVVVLSGKGNGGYNILAPVGLVVDRSRRLVDAAVCGENCENALRHWRVAVESHGWEAMVGNILVVSRGDADLFENAVASSLSFKLLLGGYVPSAYQGSDWTQGTHFATPQRAHRGSGASVGLAAGEKFTMGGAKFSNSASQFQHSPTDRILNIHSLRRQRKLKRPGTFFANSERPPVIRLQNGPQAQIS